MLRRHIRDCVGLHRADALPIDEHITDRVAALRRDGVLLAAAPHHGHGPLRAYRAAVRCLRRYVVHSDLLTIDHQAPDLAVVQDDALPALRDLDGLALALSVHDHLAVARARAVAQGDAVRV